MSVKSYSEQSASPCALDKLRQTLDSAMYGKLTHSSSNTPFPKQPQVEQLPAAISSSQIDQLIHRYAQLHSRITVSTSQMTILNSRLQSEFELRQKAEIDLETSSQQNSALTSKILELESRIDRVLKQNTELVHDLSQSRESTSKVQEQCQSEIQRCQSEMQQTLSRKDDQLSSLKETNQELAQRHSEVSKRAERFRHQCSQMSSQVEVNEQKFKAAMKDLSLLTSDRERDKEQMDDLKSRLIAALSVSNRDSERHTDLTAQLQKENLDLLDSARSKDHKIHDLELNMAEQKFSNKPAIMCDRSVQVQFDTMKLDMLRSQLLTANTEIKSLRRKLQESNELTQKLQASQTESDKMKQKQVDSLAQTLQHLREEMQRLQLDKEHEVAQYEVLRAGVLDKEAEISRLRATVAQLDTEKQIMTEKLKAKNASTESSEIVTKKRTHVPLLDELRDHTVFGDTGDEGHEYVEPLDAKFLGEETFISPDKSPSPKRKEKSVAFAGMLNEETLHMLDDRIRFLERAFKPQSSVDEENTPPTVNIAEPSFMQHNRTIHRLDERIQALQETLATLAPKEKPRVNDFSRDTTPTDETLREAIANTFEYRATLDLISRLDLIDH